MTLSITLGLIRAMLRVGIHPTLMALNRGDAVLPWT